MARPIPLITSEDGIVTVNAHYADSEMVRVGLDRAHKFLGSLTAGLPTWIDPCVDGMDDLTPRENKPWYAFMGSFPHFEEIGHPSYQSAPVRSEVRDFVFALLDTCASFGPAWITAPQLPAVDDAGRNKINRELAAQAGQWKSGSGFGGDLIMPLILTHSDQSKDAQARKSKIQNAARCYQSSGASGIWVVDKSLDDDSGAKSLYAKRLPDMIKFHAEINAAIPAQHKIAGPYWALNLILWAKGLVTHPLVGVGTAYQFFMSGGFANPPSPKIALPSLRRRVTLRPETGPWMDEAISILSPSEPARAELVQIRSQLGALGNIRLAKEQTAIFYKEWCDQVESFVPASRTIGLCNLLLDACHLGVRLPSIPKEQPRRPEAVAKPLMLNCM